MIRTKNKILKLDTKQITETILNKEDLVKISYLAKSPNKKAIKIIYVRNETIIDYELILFSNYKNQYINTIHKIVNRLYSLNANGYYLLCNYNFKHISFLTANIKLIKSLSKDVEGFLGYLVLSDHYYTWITKNDNKLIVERKQTVNKSLGINIQNILKDNPYMRIKINSKNDLIKILYEMNDFKNFSTLIITDINNKVVLNKDISNHFIILSYRQIGNYIKNILKQTNGENVFLVTQNKFFFERALELKNEKYITFCVAYNMIGKNLKIIDY